MHNSTKIGQWIDEIPPLASAQRYGNKAFRLWLGRLESEAPNLLRLLLPADLLDATVEVVPYFLVSFGDKTRIDYGTGHELNFIAFILCLAKLGVFGPNDLPVIVLHVFHHYLNLMRKLQTVYWLEPAGSKGVWGLDDYQFLAFYWGASQLIGCENDGITPSSIHSQAIVDKCVDDYLYFSCIRFITKMKRGRFEEYAPLLNDISAVPFWEKVNSGLLRMYYKEVLNKFPVVQHFLFGSILRYSSE